VKRSIRVQVADWLAVSPAARIIEWTNGILSLLSVLMYIIQDLFDAIDSELATAQEYMNLFFAADFLLHLYAAESRSRYIFNKYVIVDIITIVPTLIIFFFKVTGNSGQRTTMEILQSFNFLRVVRLIKVQHLVLRENNNAREYGGPNVRRQLIGALIKFFVVLFSFAGAYLTIENEFAPTSMLKRRNRGRLTIIDCLYFVATTVSTVGYGDLAPLSVPGKFLVSIMIMTALAIISDTLNQIVTLITSQSPYARDSYSPSGLAKHVVVCGKFDSTSMNDFLCEFFHPDHCARDEMFHVVILGQDTPDLTMKSLLEDERFFTHTKYIEGLVMMDKDLARARVDQAESVFILSNKDSSNSKDLDAATVFRAMSIKKYVRMQANKDIFIVMQLIQSRSRVNFQHSCYGNTNFQIVCIDEIKQGLLAKSCLCPGFSTLVSNLITSSNFEAQEHMETWLYEYIQGCGKEMYRAKLSRAFEGKPFAQVANIVYENYHCTLFALEVVDRQGRVRVVMSPAKYEIPSGSTYGFLIADNADKVNDVLNHGWKEQREMDPKDHDDDDQEKVSAVNLTKLNSVEVAEDFMSSRAEVDKMKLNYHYVDEAIDLESAVKNQVEELKGHILLLGSAQSHVFFVETLRRKHVVPKDIVILTSEKPGHETWSRIRHFPGVHFIIGNQNSRKDLVRAGIHGLDTAVIISAQKAVVKCRGKAKTTKDKKKDDLILNEMKGGGRLLDADCIFAYQAIRKHCPTAKIICQLRRAENILFLGADLGRFNDIMITPSFASGMVFLSAMMDRLTAQCFYNRDLLNILQALVSSGTYGKNDFSGDVDPSELGFQPVPRSFEGKTYMQLFKYLISKRSTLPLGLYRRCPMDDVSPQPYVITNPSPDLLINVQDSVFALLSPENMQQAPLGDIVVVVVEGDLPPRSSAFGLSQLANSVSCLIESEGESAQTDSCINTLMPHWNYSCRFSVMDDSGYLEVSAFEGDKLRPDTFIGKVSVAMSTLLDHPDWVNGRLVSLDSWYNLTGRHHDGMQAKGKLRLQLCLLPFAAGLTDDRMDDGPGPRPLPPLSRRHDIVSDRRSSTAASAGLKSAKRRVPAPASSSKNPAFSRGWGTGQEDDGGGRGGRHPSEI